MVSGDVPLISKDTMTTFLNAMERSKSPLGFITLTLSDPGEYGRVLRSGRTVSNIIEAKDYDSTIYGPEPNEINAGIYCLELDRIEPLLPLLQNKNKSGEFYITDLISLAVRADMDVVGVQCGDDSSLLGVNNPQELIRTENILREDIVCAIGWKRACSSILPNPCVSDRMWSLRRARAFRDPCEILGASRIAAHAEVEPFCHLNHVDLGEGAKVRSFSHLENATLKAVRHGRAIRAAAPRRCWKRAPGWAISWKLKTLLWRAGPAGTSPIWATPTLVKRPTSAPEPSPAITMATKNTAPPLRPAPSLAATRPWWPRSALAKAASWAPVPPSPKTCPTTPWP